MNKESFTPWCEEMKNLDNLRNEDRRSEDLQFDDVMITKIEN